MSNLESWELASYVVTVIGLPLAIAVFLFEQRKERENEDEAAYQLLSDAYTDFLKLVLVNTDLQLRTRDHVTDRTPDQRERMMVLYEILIALFERAYLLAYDENMSVQKRRRWLSWEDYMREWCARADFRSALPTLLQGEDADFAAYIRRLAQEGQAGN
ncbi:MAG TPA: hypothetical protein VEP67_08950 [Thiobacillaceae bacterium]|nr:hypothetical protein [Thiobacillaceae bacterium]